MSWGIGYWNCSESSWKHDIYSFYTELITPKHLPTMNSSPDSFVHLLTLGWPGGLSISAVHVISKVVQTDVHTIPDRNGPIFDLLRLSF